MIVFRICRLEWSEPIITALTAIFREISLNQDELGKIFIKVMRYNVTKLSTARHGVTLI